jgi:hypothetical protein
MAVVRIPIIVAAAIIPGVVVATIISVVTSGKSRNCHRKGKANDS